MSDSPLAWQTPDAPRRLDANVVRIELTWPASFGEPVNRGRNAIRGATWVNALEVRFGSKEQPNISQSNPGGGPPFVLPLATAMKRAGPKSTAGDTVSARIIARPATWPLILTARVLMYTDWRWSGLAAGAYVAFVAPADMQLKLGRDVFPEIGTIAPNRSNPAPTSGRGTFRFEATLA